MLVGGGATSPPNILTSYCEPWLSISLYPWRREEPWSHIRVCFVLPHRAWGARPAHLTGVFEMGDPFVRIDQFVLILPTGGRRYCPPPMCCHICWLLHDYGIVILYVLLSLQTPLWSNQMVFTAGPQGSLGFFSPLVSFRYSIRIFVIALSS